MNGHFFFFFFTAFHWWYILLCSNMFHLSFLQYFVINIGLSLSTVWPASNSAVLHGLFMLNLLNMVASHADQFLTCHCTQNIWKLWITVSKETLCSLLQSVISYFIFHLSTSLVIHITPKASLRMSVLNQHWNKFYKSPFSFVFLCVQSHTGICVGFCTGVSPKSS